MIVTQGLTKTFRDPRRGEVHAVEDVDFEARPGQVHGLLGKNGAGKTTFLRMLSTVLQPTRGSAAIDGLDVVRDAERVRARLGFMSTSTALYGRLSPLEILRYFGALYGLTPAQIEERVGTVIDKLGIESYQKALCDTLSTGQRQRVNIARTILHDPPVLFFDEPTSGLDVVMAQDVMRFIEAEREAGKTIVYCTHIMSEVERLCDQVTVIHDGKAMAHGTVESLKEQTGKPTLERAFLSIVGVEA